jgi:hypothetical protein
MWLEGQSSKIPIQFILHSTAISGISNFTESYVVIFTTFISLRLDILERDRLCSLVVRAPWYKSRGPWFDSQCYQIFWEVAGLERGPLRSLYLCPPVRRWHSYISQAPGSFLSSVTCHPGLRWRYSKPPYRTVLYFCTVNISLHIPTTHGTVKDSGRKFHFVLGRTYYACFPSYTWVYIVRQQILYINS